MKNSNLFLSAFAAALILSFSNVTSAPRDPKEARRLYDLSLKQDDVKSIQTLKQAAELDPSNVMVFYRTGYLYHKMNRFSEAEENYRKAIGVDPCHEKSLNNLGGIYVSRKEIAAGEKMYEKALACAPKSATAAYNLANLRQDAGKTESAKALYEKAIALAPTHARSHHNLALIQYEEAFSKPEDRTKLLSSAEDHLRKAIRTTPNDGLAWYNLGLVLAAQGKNQQALKAQKRAETLSEDRANLLRKIRPEIQRLQEILHLN